MVTASMYVFWVVAFARDPRPAPKKPAFGIGDVCTQMDAGHPLRKRSTRAVLLGAGQEVIARKPRIAALLRAPGTTASGKEAAAPAPGIVQGTNRPGHRTTVTFR
jgi:hypothetical protein